MCFSIRNSECEVNRKRCQPYVFLLQITQEMSIGKHILYISYSMQDFCFASCVDANNIQIPNF